MLKTSAIRELFQGRLREHRDPRAGRRAFLRDWYDTLGISCNHNMQPEYLTEGNGRYHFGEGRASPSEVSLRGLAEAIHGHEFVEEYYHPSSGFEFSELREAAIDPTAFLNISTFNLAVAGLVDAQILERYNQPQYIGRNLVRIVPSRKNGDKIIGVARMPQADRDSMRRLPGEPHAEIGNGEAYQTTPETVEQALKASVTREAVFFDLTGEVLDEAGNVGDIISYGQEKDIANEVLGVTNSYNRDGTSYNTYQAASPWVNDQSNEFLDYQNLDNARQLFVGMTDPETGKEIQVNANTVLVMPKKAALTRAMLQMTGALLGSQLTGGNFPQVFNQTPSVIGQIAGYQGTGGGSFQVIELSAIWYNRATATDGLGLAAANAQKYWWLGDFQGAFEWRENWPLTPWQASADQLTLKDRGLIMVYGANQRGIAYTREPRKVVRNKN